MLHRALRGPSRPPTCLFAAESCQAELQGGDVDVGGLVDVDVGFVGLVWMVGWMVHQFELIELVASKFQAAGFV